MNKSPWISNLKIKIESDILGSNQNTDVVVIGGGVSGVMTAYNILQNSEKKIILLESNKCGFGATGHNAGMMVTFIENIDEIISSKKYSDDVIKNTLKVVGDSWDEFYKIVALVPIVRDYFSQVNGISGYEDIESLLDNYKKFQLMKKYDLDLKEEFYISNEIDLENLQLNELKKLSSEEISKFVPGCSKSLVGFSKMPNLGVMNSAQFVQDVLQYLKEKFSTRIKIFEGSKVKEIVNLEGKNICVVDDYYIESKQIVVATNGYKLPNIVGRNDFEQVTIQGVVNHMLAKNFDKEIKPLAYAIYKEEVGVEGEIDYIYGTSRNIGGNGLFTFGNSRDEIVDGDAYDSNSEIDEAIKKELMIQAQSYLDVYDDGKSDYMWHGMMGYTNSRNRIVSEFPKGSGIIYNIGCNGVGIMPAIASGILLKDFFQSGEMIKTFWSVE